MSALVAAARSYTGVPFVHQGRSRHGLDCVGLVWIAYRDAGVALEDFRAYHRTPRKDGLVAHAQARLGDPVAVAPVRLCALQPGDVVVIRWEREPHHVGVVGEREYGATRALSLIHASGTDKRVLEHRLLPSFLPQITHVFRRPV